MIETLGVERLWQLTAEHSPVGMVLVSPAGIVLTANRALCTMLGCHESDLLGKGYELLTHVADRPGHVALFDDMISGGRDSYRLTKRCQRADGGVLWGDLSAALLRDDDGTPLYAIGQIIDVTPQREHEARLAEALEVIKRQRRTSQAILDTVDVGLVLIDQDGRYEESNRRHQGFLALAFPQGHHGQSGQLGDVYAADATTLLTSEEMPTSRAVRGEEFDHSIMWLGSDPVMRRAIAVSARSVRDADGGFAGAALAYSDITDLMRAMRARDDFLAAVSHELRTPLSSVLGHLELLLEDGALDEESERLIKVAERNAWRLNHLVRDLLESAQRRGGDLELVRVALDLEELVREAVESAQPSATAAGIRLDLTTPGPLPTLADGQRLRQVVDNLLSNAIKYSERGGHVRVRLAHDDGRALVVVADDGIGIPSADLDRLFTPFFRTAQARERLTPGVGLGLSIVETIVAAHGGHVDVTSEPGLGATFRVDLPVIDP